MKFEWVCIVCYRYHIWKSLQWYYVNQQYDSLIFIICYKGATWYYRRCAKFRTYLLFVLPMQRSRAQMLFTKLRLTGTCGECDPESEFHECAERWLATCGHSAAICGAHNRYRYHISMPYQWFDLSHGV